jgi:hypothetical protein
VSLTVTQYVVMQPQQGQQLQIMQEPHEIYYRERQQP